MYPPSIFLFVEVSNLVSYLPGIFQSKYIFGFVLFCFVFFLQYYLLHSDYIYVQKHTNKIADK